jgi:hypothetical protein
MVPEQVTSQKKGDMSCMHVQLKEQQQALTCTHLAWLACTSFMICSSSAGVMYSGM